MKTKTLILTTTLGLGMVFHGCEKDENAINNKQFLKEQTIKSNTVLNKTSQSDTTFIPQNEFEVEFEPFAETFFLNNPIGLIVITPMLDEELYAITTEEEGPTTPSAERVVCRGTDAGTVFKCAKLYARFNIFGCGVDVYKKPFDDGSGRYYYEGHTDC